MTTCIDATKDRLAMITPRTYIGRFEHRLSDVAAEYFALAQEDEKVGQLLIGQGQCRHAIYFLLIHVELERHQRSRTVRNRFRKAFGV